MLKERRTLYDQIEKNRGSKLLVYVTGDRPGLETQISQEVYDFFVNHLDKIGVTKKISLYLYTRGGQTLVAWSLINLIRQFCDELEIIVPSKAHSAGTLMCLGADKILMTKQATLGPIDPSLNSPLNPQIPGAGPEAKVPVSVEAINGFIELAKEELKIDNQECLTQLLISLSGKVHPLVLGESFRSKSQIQMLARKLVSKQVSDNKKVDDIISFLCSESGSHDYTINRREAKDSLGLKIEKPDEGLYRVIKAVYDDIETELQLTSRLDPNAHLGKNQKASYSFTRCLVESVPGGSNYFISEGEFFRQQIQVAPGVTQTAIQDQRLFEGWRFKDAKE